MAAQSSNGGATAGDLRNGSDTNVNIPARIHDALQLIHNPYSANDARREAQQFLEEVKAIDEAPLHGYTLASDKTQPPVVRHYALSLLEHAIKHRWSEYSDNEAGALRGWVLQLCQGVSKEDPPYLRNKTAQLWVEVAKRSWAAEWMDMDQLLVQLWQVPDSAVHKELVMFILETLSEEVFTGDDPVVALREGILSKACVEIFTPAAVLLEAFPNRQPGPDVRCGGEGWLARVSELLGHCLNGDMQGNEDVKMCAVRALHLFYALMSWSIPKAVAGAGCVAVMRQALAASNVAVQKVCLSYRVEARNATNFHRLLLKHSMLYIRELTLPKTNSRTWSCQCMTKPPSIYAAAFSSGLA
jgi:exportin-5